MEIELSPGAETPKPNDDEKDLVGTSFNSMSNGHSFNKILKGVEVLYATPPTILAMLTLNEQHMNDMGLMHTGFAAAMADILTAAAVRLTAAKQTPVVSVDLSVTFLQPARIGDTVLMEANCMRAAGSIAFTEAIFRRKNDGELILKASQQLAILHYLPLKTKESGNETKGRKEEQQNGHKNELADAVECNGFMKNSEREEKDERVYKLDRAQQLLARMARTKNFNSVAENLAVSKADPSMFEVEFQLGYEHLNEGGTMHGGFIASLVDIVSVCASEMAAPNSSMASMFVSISYLLPAKIGEDIVAKSVCLKVGRNIAFTETTISRKRDGAMLAKGKHDILLTRRGEEGRDN